MSPDLETNCVRIQCDRKRYFKSQRPLWLILGILELLLLGEIFLALLAKLELPLTLYVGALGIAIFMALLGLLLLPGQGDLLLTSEGVRVNHFFNLGVFGRWEEINGFYLYSDCQSTNNPKVIICEIQKVVVRSILAIVRLFFHH